MITTMLILLAIFFALGYLFKIIIESYALRSKATMCSFFANNSVKNKDLEAFNIIIRKCEHLAQSAGNWTVPIIVIAQAAEDVRSNRNNFFEKLQQRIDSCQDEKVKVFLQLRKKSLEKYLLIYLFFGSPIIPLLALASAYLCYLFFMSSPLLALLALLTFLIVGYLKKIFDVKNLRLALLSCLARLIESNDKSVVLSEIAR